MADHQSSMNWTMMVSLVLAVVPAAIGLFSASRVAAVLALAVGAVYSVMMVLDGVSHGVGEGNRATLVLALVAVGVPTTVTVLRNVAWIRGAGPRTAQTSALRES